LLNFLYFTKNREFIALFLRFITHTQLEIFNCVTGLSPTRKKTKLIVLFVALIYVKLTQTYALTSSSNETQVVLYHERFEEAGRRDKHLL